MINSLIYALSEALNLIPFPLSIDVLKSGVKSETFCEFYFKNGSYAYNFYKIFPFYFKNTYLLSVDAINTFRKTKIVFYNLKHYASTGESKNLEM